jgi:GWxTD domain-containing protein
VRTVLGYIATGEERLGIETASPDSLPAVWGRFWKRRDPTPGTASNEALNRFVDRVTQATNRFGGVVPGWRSDRGRILIQHGTPERTERVFDQVTRTDTEIWYYDQRNMSYVFQDPEGFGNYRLTGGQ